MNPNELRLVLNRMGSYNIRENGAWWSLPCPLAPWAHFGGRDTHPSFQVSVDDSKGTHFANCFACRFKGSLGTLLREYQNKSGYDPELDRIAQEQRGFGSNLSARLARPARPEGEELGIDKKYLARDEDLPPIEIGGIEVPGALAARLGLQGGVPHYGPEILAEYDALTPANHAYLQGPKRRLLPATLRAFGLLSESWSGRVVIPIYDVLGRLVGYSRKAMHKGEDIIPYLDMKKFKKKCYLYGEDRIDFTQKRCYLVEGYFDVMALLQRGYVNVLATMGTELGPVQITKILQWFGEVIIVPDGDDPGYAAGESWQEKLAFRIDSHIARTPRGKDPDDLDAAEDLDLLGAPPRAGLPIAPSCAIKGTFKLLDSASRDDTITAFSAAASSTNITASTTITKHHCRIEVVQYIEEDEMAELDQSGMRVREVRIPGQRPGGDFPVATQFDKDTGFIFKRRPLDFKLPQGGNKEFIILGPGAVHAEPYPCKMHRPSITMKGKDGQTKQRWMRTTCLDGVYEQRCCELWPEKRPANMEFFTVVENCKASVAYVDKDGVVRHMEPFFFCGTSETIDALLLCKEEELNGMLFYHVLKAFRGNDQTSCSVGSTFKVVRNKATHVPTAVDPAALYKRLTWNGHKLSELIADANSSRTDAADYKAALARIFQLEYDDQGLIIEKPYAFNYAELLKPMSPAELEKWAGVKPRAAQPAPRAQAAPAARAGVAAPSARFTSTSKRGGYTSPFDNDANEDAPATSRLAVPPSYSVEEDEGDDQIPFARPAALDGIPMVNDGAVAWFGHSPKF